MSDIDSPIARQRIEDGGKNVEALSDYMDRLVESQGNS